MQSRPPRPLIGQGKGAPAEGMIGSGGFAGHAAGHSIAAGWGCFRLARALLHAGANHSRAAGSG
jgi:hypothetical protein